MAPPKDIARSYPKRGLTADVGFRSEPKFCGDGAATFPTLSDYAQTAASADLALGETYTLCAWVRSVKPSGANHVVNIGVSGTIKVSISFFGGVSNPEVYCYNGSGNMNTTGVFNSDPHTWYHIAMVIKPGAGNSQIFINGIDRTASHSYTFPLSGSPVVHIGGDYSASNGDWEGDLANVALFTSSLTEDQVRQAMRASDYASHAAIATLEAFYPLSENFNDSTGNHNATASGSPLFRPNRPQLPRGLDLARGAAQARVYTGRSIDLDGSADYLETTLDSALGSTFTITAWIYKDNVSSNRFVALTGTSGAGNAASIYVNVDKLGGWDGSSNLDTTLSLSANRWYHVALVANGTTTLTYYLDGQSDTVTSSAVPNPSNSIFRVGAYSSSFFLHDGKISGMRVFNQALTADQIKDLYHHPEQVLPTGVSASALIHYWALSDYNDTGATGGRYFQDSAGSNALEDKSSASMAFAQPVPCPQLGLQQSATRLWHPGASQGATATITAPGTTVSLSAWIFWDQARTSYAIHLGTVTSSTDSFHVRVNASGQVSIYQGTEYLSGLTITEGGWNHIVVATRSDSPYWRCWLNNSEASSPAVANVTNITSTSCYLGMNNSNYGMGGIANDAAVWNTELGDSDVAALYNSGVQGMDVSTVQSANLKGWWKFDDLTTLKDYSGNSASATVSGTFAAASFPENASGSTIVGDFSMKRKGVSVLNFGAVTNGANEYALSAKDSAFLPSFANGGAFSCFFRLQQLGEYSSIFINDDYNSGIQHRFAIYLTTIDKIIVELGDGASARANPQTTGTISDSDWHHFAMTVDYGGGATTTIKLFIDGVLDSTSTATTLAGVPNATALRFGDYVTSGANEMNGPIACLKFYQVTLSENEIKQIYNSDLRLIKGLENE